ncbi:MAG TPA: tryptophan--tRNA ligase [Kineosporiaceae bacterium]|nr:tryptophan--tRNA ligase [Kineosporiaceae bacterium]
MSGITGTTRPAVDVLIADPSVLPPATRVVTGLTASGRPHLGNYLGAILPLLRLAADPGTHALVFVADVHALTVDHAPALLRERTRDLAATLLACGLGADSTLFVQSAVPAHAELGGLLLSAVSYGELTRMIQFKVKGDGQDGVRASLLTYPALMAADILVHQADAVPVGEDQRQHLELTRTVAQRFNARYGPVFTVPRGIVPPAAARIRDLRNPAAKMAKSTAGTGTVYLTDPPVRLAEAVRRAVTDLDPDLVYDPDLRPGVANLAEILAALTGRTPQAALSGLHGSGALKAAVTDALVETLRPVRDRYAELIADSAALDAILARGALLAAEHAAPTLTAARHALGLS